MVPVGALGGVQETLSARISAKSTETVCGASGGAKLGYSCSIAVRNTVVLLRGTQYSRAGKVFAESLWFRIKKFC